MFEAFYAWQLAVGELEFLDPDTLSMDDLRQLARQYGRAITNQEDLDTVEKWFDWNRIFADVKKGC